MESPFQASMILLGDIGQPEAVELNNDLRKFIPSVYALFEKGLLIPNAYREEGQGIEGILKAWELQKKGSTGGVKIVAKIAGDN